MRLLIAPVVAVWALCACSSSSHKAAATSPPPAPAPAPSTPSSQPAPGPDGGIPAQKLEDLPEGDSYLTNLPQLVDQMGLAPYYQLNQHAQGVTIAILDNGFAGLDHSLGKRLPPDTQLLPAPLPQEENTTHGVKLAEIVYALATGSATYRADIQGPKILLANTDGFTNFSAAVDAVVAAKVDIVLYAQVWEYGGNFNGQGFVNAEVDKATAAGILWINAAGNFGQAVFNSGIATQANGLDVVLPYQQKYVRMSVPSDGVPIKAVLSWNDWDETTTYTTHQDLDLILEDQNHKEVGESRLRQDGDKSDPNFSAYPREIIDGVLAAGLYYLRVEEISHNFTADSRLRLAVDGVGVSFLDRSTDDTVMIPADNPSVLSIGANDVDYSGSDAAPVNGRAKPELTCASLVTFSDGDVHQGTSASSAIVAGTVAVLDGAYGKLGRDGILSLVDQGKITPTVVPPTQTATLKLPPPSSL